MRADIQPGASFPDYELTDHTGTRRRLSDLQGNNPMVLVLSRGGYCPKDRHQTLQLVSLQAELRDGVGYARLVTISTDSVAETNEYRNGTGADWPFLSDPRRTVQQDLQIQEFTDPLKNPMIPHTLVLEPGLVVHKVYNGYWYWGRPTIAELRTDLREVTRRCRPDWDVTAPGWREAWEAGDRARFYPYGRTHAEIFAGTGVGGTSSTEGLAQQGPATQVGA